VQQDWLLTTREVADYLGIPVQTIYQWNSRNIGPRRLRVGRYVRYRKADVERWLTAREITADAA